MEENKEIVDVKKFQDELDDLVKKAKESFKVQLNEDITTLDFSKTMIHGNAKQIQALFTDYSKYSGEVDNPKNTKTNPFHKNKYAPLDEVMNVIKPIMSKYNLALMQIPTSKGGMVGVNNILTHKDGAFMTFEELSAKPTKADVQGLGATLTYLRRYSVSAIGGVASEEDDDGNNGSGLPNAPKQKTPPKQSTKPPVKKEPTELEKTITEIGLEVGKLVKAEKTDVIEGIVTKDQAEKNYKKIKDVKIAKSVLTDLKAELAKK